MPTVIPNRAMKSVLLKNTIVDINNNLEDVTISLFTGTPPTKADLVANVDSWHSNGWAKPSSGFIDWITGTHGSTELVRQRYSNFSYIEHIDFTTVRFCFSRSTDVSTPLADGLVGWFLMLQHDEATSYTGADVRSAAVGTVGLIGSGADMEVTDTNIVTTKPFKFNDIQIDFNIQGVSS